MKTIRERYANISLKTTFQLKSDLTNRSILCGSQRQHLGVYNAWGTPVSIPNTEVKSRRAYGTSVRSGGRVGRRQDAIFERMNILEESSTSS